MAYYQNPIFFLLISILIFMQQHALAQKQVVRAAYWLSSSNFPVSQIDSTQFTHLFCGFADVDPINFRVSISPSNLSPFSNFTKNVQQKNPSVKTLLSIGGGNDADVVTLSLMAGFPVYRKRFIDSSISLARSMNFHGLDLYWAYPKADSDMIGYGLLVDEFRSAIVSESKVSGKARLLLSAAVYYKPRIESYMIDYPSKLLANRLDWINLMAYNFTSPILSPRVTRSHAALLDPSGKNISGSSGVNAWIQSGMPSKKIVLGLPFYGYSWRLLNRGNHDLNAPARGPIGGGDGSIGFKPAAEFCLRATNPWIVEVVIRYCYLGTTWISYDDTFAIFTKVAYAKKNKLLGYFAWHVGLDDDRWILSEQASQAWELAD